MSCQTHVGILDQNGKLTKQAKENFISEVLLVLEYGTENIPSDKKPVIPYSDKLDPDPSSVDLVKDPTYLRDETIYADFHKTWIGRYEKLANDLNFAPNFSLLPAMADPIAIGGSAFNAELPSPEFPNGFVPYFSGLLPLKLIGDLVDSGETKFLSPTGPIDLVKTLLEKKAPPIPSPPTPPIITPPSPPPGFSLPAISPDQLKQPELSPEQLALQLKIDSPKPPEAVFSSLAEKEFAAFEKLPEAILGLIGKVPSILGKLANPGEAIAEVGKAIKKSGILGPEPEETSTLEKAAQTVLASKISEMSTVAVLAITVGSSPGSVTTSLTQKTSSQLPEKKYKPAPREEPPKKKKLSPAQKAIRRAEGLAGSSYGSSANRTRYLQGLFYAESMYRNFENLNVYGEFIPGRDENDPTTAPINRDELKSYTKLTEAINAINNGRARLEYTPVDSPSGFFELQERSAGDLSSCGMFVRCCYQAAGALNNFFLSLYTHGSAVQMLQNIGFMRNFRWVSENPNYDFQNESKRAIMNDLFIVEENPETKEITLIERDENLIIPGVSDAEGKQINVGKFKNLLFGTAASPGIIGQNSVYNQIFEGTKQKKNDASFEELIGPANIEFQGDWVLEINLNGEAKPKTNRMNFLKTYVKPLEERAYLSVQDIGRMTTDEKLFPDLAAGDAMLIVRTQLPEREFPGGQRTDHAVNGEHVLMIGADRPAGYKYSSPENVLENPLFGIEGGSLDDENLKEKERDDIFHKIEAIKALLQDAVGGSKNDSKNYPLLKGLTQEDADSAIAVVEGKSTTATGKLAGAVSYDPQNNVGTLKLRGTVKVPKPSAILECKHDLGFITPSYGFPGVPNNYKGAGFFLGASVMARTSQAGNVNSLKQGESFMTPPATRRIIGIFKTNNYCNEAENSGPLAARAAVYMDQICVNDSSKYWRSNNIIDVLGSYVFKGIFKIPKGKKKVAQTANGVAVAEDGKISEPTGEDAGTE